MDWRVFLGTFGAVFFAELADKTQMVGITMAKFINPQVIRYFGAGTFILLGILMLMRVV